MGENAGMGVPGVASDGNRSARKGLGRVATVGAQRNRDGFAMVGERQQGGERVRTNRVTEGNALSRLVSPFETRRWRAERNNPF